VQAQAIAKKNRRHSKFNLNAYLEEEGIGFGNGPKIKLKIKMDRYAAWHFRETPISTDQTWNELDGNHVIITATVRSSEELRWWLLSYENRLEVLAPNRLRKQMQESIQQMATVYSDSK
jgi:predicted DNA-binding transcriptional regulator YafY